MNRFAIPAVLAAVLITGAFLLLRDNSNTESTSAGANGTSTATDSRDNTGTQADAAASDAADSATTSDGSSSDGRRDGDEAEIVGRDSLSEAGRDALEPIANIVDVGDCQPPFNDVPEAMECRVVDGGDPSVFGTTMFNVETNPYGLTANELNITVGPADGMGVDPCQALPELCAGDPIDLGAQWDEAQIAEFGGAITVTARHVQTGDLFVATSFTDSDAIRDLIARVARSADPVS